MNQGNIAEQSYTSWHLMICKFALADLPTAVVLLFRFTARLMNGPQIKVFNTYISMLILKLI